MFSGYETRRLAEIVGGRIYHQSNTANKEDVLQLEKYQRHRNNRNTMDGKITWGGKSNIPIVQVKYMSMQQALCALGVQTWQLCIR